jgi:hypothetical protein
MVRRTSSLFLLALTIALSTTAHAKQLPSDGNGLLDACSVMVDFADNQTAAAALSNDKLTEKLAQLDWCAGYLQGTEDVFEHNFISLGILAMAGLKFDGPDKLQQYALDTLNGPCFPGKAPVLQLARVLVKWLREHPERLHEPKGVLTIAAFMDAFHCDHAATPPPNEEAKPKPAK